MSIYSHTNTSIDRWVDGWVGRYGSVDVWFRERGGRDKLDNLTLADEQG